MPQVPSLTEAAEVGTDVETYLAQIVEVFCDVRGHDSGCVSYGVESGGRRWFVKHSSAPRGMAGLRRAQDLHGVARHEALPPLRNSFRTPGGLALVYDWVPGEVLHDGVNRTAAERRSDPAHPHVRFRSLPLSEVLAAIDTIYDVHVLLADLGFVAVDLYDGCFLYDFAASRMYLCDLDEYRRGAFVLEADRLPGSTRFMAPEEFTRGARIDQVTNVFALGRTAAILLGDSMPSLEHFRGTDRMREVIVRATAPDRAARHSSVREFVAGWRAAARDALPA